ALFRAAMGGEHGDVLAVERDPAARLDEAADGAEQAALAGAVRAPDGHYAGGGHTEVDVEADLDAAAARRHATALHERPRRRGGGGRRRGGKGGGGPGVWLSLAERAEIDADEFRPAADLVRPTPIEHPAALQ